MTSVAESMESKESKSCEYDFIPRDLWYQDPVYKAYARLFISDVVAMLPYSTGPDEAFAYKNHPVYRVDILGLVVSVAEREKFFKYAVDDGTGVIQCCCWKPQRAEESKPKPQVGSAGDPEAVLAAALRKRMEDSDTGLLTPCDLGALIHVRGRLKSYRGNNEVSASYFKKIEDPTFQTEIWRMQEQPVLYQSVYDVPFRLPGNAQQQEADERRGLKREAHLVRVVQEKLSKLLEEKTIADFYLQELDTVEELMDVAALPCVEYQDEPSTSAKRGAAKQIKAIFRSAVEKLVDDGKVFRSGEKQGLFLPVCGNVQLSGSILDILRLDCQQKKYEEGCHYLHVLDRLHNQPRYEQIGRTAVKEALTWLESNSQVISTTQNHYIAIV